MAHVGFIGLGKMGRPIVARLLEAGHTVTVWNRSADKAAEPVGKGATLAANPAAVADAVEILFTMVADAAALETVLTGAGGVLSAARGRPPVFDMTTVLPAQSRALAAAARQAGFTLLDAPVAGGPPVAAKGALGMMVGGPEALVARWRPVLEAFTGTLVHVGDHGQGSALKLINNLTLATALQATAEAMVFARRCGIDPEKMIEINASGGAQMRMMQTRGPRMIARNFTADATLDLIHKDVSSALALADAVGAPLPVGATVLEMVKASRLRGMGGKDMAALVTVVEALAGETEAGDAGAGDAGEG